MKKFIVGAGEQARALGELPRLGSKGGTGGFSEWSLLSWLKCAHLRRGEFLTTRAASGVDDLATVFGFHSLTESTGGLALFLAGLVGAFHGVFLSKTIIFVGVNIADPIKIPQGLNNNRN